MHASNLRRRSLMSLQQSTRQFVERMNHVLENMHNAIEDRDVDEQHAALAAIVGLVEMLRSEIEHGEEEDDNGNPH
jgi:hypothetical protein